MPALAVNGYAGISAQSGGNITIDGGSGDNSVFSLAGFENRINIQSSSADEDANLSNNPPAANMPVENPAPQDTTEADNAEADIIEQIYAQRRQEAEFVEDLEERRRDEAEYVDRLHEQRSEQATYSRGRRNGRNAYTSAINNTSRELGLV